jgi:hypothetical protein
MRADDAVSGLPRPHLFPGGACRHQQKKREQDGEASEPHREHLPPVIPVIRATLAGPA